MTRVIYNPPDFTYKVLKKFQLKNLKKKFKSANFERRISGRHVNRIMKAIMNNKFYDNVIRVTKGNNSQWIVIDGQHRIEALQRMHDEHNLVSYDLVLQIYTKEEQRDIYRRLNLGKTLALKDHLRAIDNGKYNFFNRLRPHYSHLGSKHMPRYENILNALYYAKGQQTRARAIQLIELEKFIKGITEDDIKIVREFTLALKKLDVNTNTKFYKANFYRNIFRIGYDNKFDRKEWEQFAKIAVDDKKVLELVDTRTTQATEEMYLYLTDEIRPKLKDKIEKIETRFAESKLVQPIGIFGRKP